VELAAQPSVQLEPAVKLVQLAFQLNAACGGTAGKSGHTLTAVRKTTQYVSNVQVDWCIV
jgi:hypothetical protein